MQRGWRTLSERVRSGGNTFFSDLAGILPSKKSDTEAEDDPNSPYSINYSGEYQRPAAPAYALSLRDDGGKQTGN